MRTRILILALLLAAYLIAPVGNVEACGPFFEPDVFVSTTSPDDLASFATGNLGILQAGYDSNEYAVAYRYLNGGKLSDSELHAYVYPAGALTVQDWSKLSPEQIAAAQAAQQKAGANAEPAAQWELVRAEYAPPESPTAPSPSTPAENSGVLVVRRNDVVDQNYLNCPHAAFANAALTLKSRADAWGKQSQWLADWIRAQDIVFSNCDGKNTAFPAPVPTGSPALLTADRAYQIASATLYAKQFDDAAKQFAAIAAAPNSPWRQWGAYLAARATVRKAFAMGKTTDPYSGDLATYDAATMNRAQQMLEALIAQPDPTPSRAITQSELNFIRIRTEPEKRAVEICSALAGPAPDSNFSQDLRDLSWFLEKQVKIETQPPLLAWIAAWRGAGTSVSAFATWQQSHQLPWLLIAMEKAGPADAFASTLVDAAAKIAPDSPAYDTAFYHRVRLLIGLKRTGEARALLDAALPALRQQKPSSKLNALLEDRMLVARDFNEFLEFAPRSLLSAGSEGTEDLQSQCNANAHGVNASTPCPELTQGLWFDKDAAEILNQQTPLSELIEAANSSTLPQSLRQPIALVAWTRSVILEDAKSTAALAPLLPKAVRDTAGSSDGFSADLAILRNPGIRPYVEEGVPRVASFSAFDEYRDNWWCTSKQDPYGDKLQLGTQYEAPAFLSSGQLAQAVSEYRRLERLPDSAALIGQRVFDYANQHPDDPQVPEALALTVRATHYACQNWEPGGSGKSEYTPVSKAAFELLHKRYPKSPWAMKTRYYYY